MSSAALPLVALVGNPNSGKTALFNALTGSRQKVANYAGVTVERKEGVAASPVWVYRVLDLPGTYALRARSVDEAITRDVVLGRLSGEARPDILLVVVDATNLKRHLRLVLELKQTGLPIVLALNMKDIADRQGIVINLPALSQALQVTVVPTVAVRKRGIEEIMAALDAAKQAPIAPSLWREPSTSDLRDLGRDVELLIAATVTHPGTPPQTTYCVDRVLLHPFWGILALLFLLFLVFQAVFSWATAPADLIDAAATGLGQWITAHAPEVWWRSLLTDGVIAGVGSVLVFLPQIMVLYFFIFMLEDTGYMARAAFLLDRIMGGVGLHGRAFIPLLSSFACAIPGIMATRTIENRNDRLATILVAPLMTCSARIPVYTLIIAAFIPREHVGWFNLQGLVMFGLYAAGIASGLLVAFVMKRTFLKSVKEPFLMELPSYRVPSIGNVLIGMWERVRIFLRRAGTVIFQLMIVIWFLSSYPKPPVGATGPAISYSFAGKIGEAIAPAFAPIGFNWQMVVALVPGMAAREVAVAALGTVYAVGDGAGTEHSLSTLLASQWSLATALSFLAWYVFAPQCLSTLAVTRRETNSRLWPTVMFIYLTGLAYLAAFATYRIAAAMGAA